jgi:hypothetical protein
MDITYRVVNLGPTERGPSAVLDKLNADGERYARERRTWMCPNEPLPDLNVGSEYSVYQLAMATRCSQVESVQFSLVE